MTNIHSNPTPLRQKFIEYLTLNRKAERTVHCYVSFIYSLAKHCRRSPDLLGPEDIRHWLYYLIAERKQAASTVNLTLKNPPLRLARQQPPRRLRAATVTPRLCLPAPTPAPDAFTEGTPGRPRLTTAAQTRPLFPTPGSATWGNPTTSSYFSSNVLGPPQPLRPTSEVSSAPGLSLATFPSAQPGALPTSHLCSA